MREGAAPQDPRWQETCLALSPFSRGSRHAALGMQLLCPQTRGVGASPGRGSSRVFVFSFLQVADVSRALGPLSPVDEFCAVCRPLIGLLGSMPTTPRQRRHIVTASSRELTGGQRSGLPRQH